MAKTIGLSLLLLLLFDCSQTLIIPQELPTLLSIVYSNIPPIKKGKDSRYGVGFRLGEHADFQMLFEFGPQTETKKIGGTSGSSSKREVDQNDFFQGLSRRETPIKTEASNWLSNWSKGMTTAQQKRKKQLQNPKKNTTANSTTSTTTTSTTIRTVPLISEDALKQLSQLFKVTVTIGMNPSTTAIPKTTEKTTKSPEQQKKISEELMDVNVEK